MRKIAIAFLTLCVVFVASCSLQSLMKGTGTLKELTDVSSFNESVRNDRSDTASFVLLVRGGEEASESVSRSLKTIAEKDDYKDIKFYKVELPGASQVRIAAKGGASDVGAEVLGDANLSADCETPVLVIYQGGEVRETKQAEAIVANADTVLKNLADDFKPEDPQEPAPESEAGENALCGLFTINGAGDRVRFSKGNLFHSGTAADSGWGFEANQYDFRTFRNNKSVIGGSEVVTSENDCGLFYWTKTNGDSYKQKYNFDEWAIGDQYLASLSDKLFADANGASIMGSQWSVLSWEEWSYVLGEGFAENFSPQIGQSKRYPTKESLNPTDDNGKRLYRLDAKKKSAHATIRTGSKDVLGIVILPDDWNECPEGCEFNSYAENIGCYGSNFINRKGYDDNVYTLEQWSAMEDAGAVFLPAAGRRFDDAYPEGFDPTGLGAVEPGNCNGSEAYEFNWDGWYWAKDVSIGFDQSQGAEVHFGGAKWNDNGTDVVDYVFTTEYAWKHRNNAYSIRLVERI